MLQRPTHTAKRKCERQASQESAHVEDQPDRLLRTSILQPSGFVVREETGLWRFCGVRYRWPTKCCCGALPGRYSVKPYNINSCHNRKSAAGEPSENPALSAGEGRGVRK